MEPNEETPVTDREAPAFREDETDNTAPTETDSATENPPAI